MAKIDYFDLISGREIPYEGICLLKPPKLSDIRDVGYDLYSSLLMLIAMDLDRYLDVSGMRDAYNNFSDEEKEIYDVFKIIVVKPDTRELLRKALCFFISENLVFDKNNCSFLVIDDEEKIIGSINSSNYGVIKSGILQLNYLSAEEPTPKKIKDKRKREILEKIARGKKEIAKTKKTDENINLPNLISSISANHSSYNLNNIWSLTVYQLYDQFFRLNNKVQLDVIGTRWAAWGKEDFDFSVWYKNLNSKN